MARARPGVEHVGRGHPVVDPARGRAHPLGHVREEGHHVVVGGALQLLGPLHREPGAGLDGGEVVRRDHPALGPRAADLQLHLEPAAQLGLLGPEGRHGGAGVARDHPPSPDGDVAPHLAPLEPHERGRRVGPVARLLDAAAARAHRQHAAAGGHDRALRPVRGAGVVDLGAGGGGLVEALDDVAAAGRPRIPVRRQHHGHRRAVVDPHRPVLQVAVGGRGQQAQGVLVQAGQQGLRLGVAEPGVELEHPRPVGRHHQPRVERAREGRPPALHLGDHRPVDPVEQLVGQRVGDVGHRRDRAHPPRVGPGVALADRLVVPRRREAGHGAAVRDGEQRHLGTGHALLHHHHPSGVAEAAGHEAGLERLAGLGLARRHDHPLAGGQAVGLDRHGQAQLRHGGHAGVDAGHGDGPRGGDAGGRHDLLGERLAALEPGGGGSGPEGPDARGAHRVAHPGHQRRLGPDHDEVHPEGARQGHDPAGVREVDGDHLGVLADARIASGAEDPGAFGGSSQRPHESMLAASTSHHQHRAAHPGTLAYAAVGGTVANGPR